jgi:L-malate glycosyltransferase
MQADITVILATYNRARDLSRTLDGMVCADKGELAVEFVVVDNGSTDQTKSVVDAFADRLSIRYIYEGRSGKNRALNTALEQVELGKIVAFTDDDVDVSPDWFVAIYAVCKRWPKHSIFGGRINVIFPIENVPKWALDQRIASLAFGYHNYSDNECIYAGTKLPFGANYWVKREVFDNGRRFNEVIGPQPTNRMMGGETSFLNSLLKDGYQIVCSPTVVVGHRIQSKVLKLSSIYQRAYSLGRGETHIQGLPSLKLLKKSVVAWRLYRNGAIIFNGLKVLTAFLFSTEDHRAINVVIKLRRLGYCIETVRATNHVLTKLRAQ